MISTAGERLGDEPLPARNIEPGHPSKAALHEENVEQHEQRHGPLCGAAVYAVQGAAVGQIVGLLRGIGRLGGEPARQVLAVRRDECARASLTWHGSGRGDGRVPCGRISPRRPRRRPRAAGKASRAAPARERNSGGRANTYPCVRARYKSLRALRSVPASRDSRRRAEHPGVPISVSPKLHCPAKFVERPMRRPRGPAGSEPGC